MKRILILTLAALALIFALASCKKSSQAQNESTETNTQASTDTGTVEAKPRTLYDQAPVHASSVVIEHDYYSQVRRAELTSRVRECFPNENGSYFLMISSYEEMQEYFLSDLIDDSVFDSNYVVLTYHHSYGADYGGKTVGLRSFRCEDGAYKITEDWTCGAVTNMFIEPTTEQKHYKILLIPKNEAEYVSGVQKLEVKYIEIEQIEINPIYGANEQSLQGSCGYVVGRGLPIVEELNASGIYSGDKDSMLIYLESIPECEFVLTEKGISRNGDLKLTFTVYEHLEPSVRTKFINVKTLPEFLADNYEIYVTFEYVSVPFNQ